MSAAFDRVNHAIVVAKLQRLGIYGSVLRWLNTYHTGRKLTVSVEGSISNEFLATSGIPQGSHLGPLIFLLYFNNVNHVLKRPRSIYADVLKMYRRICSVSDARNLQQEIYTFTDWCALNCMTVNQSKCSSINFARIRQPIGIAIQRAPCRPC